jgi:hypothetical protein
MTELLAIRKELTEMRYMIEDMRNLLVRKPVNKRWLQVKEFMAATGKTRNQVEGLFKSHPELKRKRDAEGVQVDYYKYKELFQ